MKRTNCLQQNKKLEVNPPTMSPSFLPVCIHLNKKWPSKDKKGYKKELSLVHLHFCISESQRPGSQQNQEQQHEAFQLSHEQQISAGGS
jgi:hypothetical protein